MLHVTKNYRSKYKITTRIHEKNSLTKARIIKQTIEITTISKSIANEIWYRLYASYWESYLIFFSIYKCDSMG